MTTEWFPWPVARFAMRQSVRWAYAAPALVVLGLLIMERGQNRDWLGNVGVFAMIYAFPHAAARWIDADRSGRLDHLRLTSQTSTRLLLSLALGWAGPWLAVSIVCLALWSTAWTLGVPGAVLFGALFGGSLALSMLALTLPRGHTGIDPRLVAVALVAVALVASALQVTAIQGLERRSLPVRPIAVLLLVAEAAVTVICLRIVRRAVARPAFGGRGRPPSVRLLNVGWKPELSRPFNLLFYPAMLLVLITSAILSVLWIALGRPAQPSGAEWAYVQLIAYLPLVVGAFVISTGARTDRDSGQFELLRLAPSRPMSMLAGLAVGACLPFMAATLAAYATALLVWGRPPEALLAALVMATIVAPITGIEGWKGRWPLVYTAPAILFFSGWIDDASDGGLSILLVAWIPWAAAAAIWRRPDAPPLSGWMGTAAIACLTFALLSSGLVVNDVVPLSALLLIVTSFIVDPSRPRAIDRWGPGAAAAITTALMAFRAPYGPAETLVLVPLPAVCWWIGLRIHQLAWPAERWSVAARIGLAIYLSTGPHVERALFDYFAPMPSGADRAFGEHRLRVYALLDALWLAMAMAIEGGHRWRTRHAARRRLVEKVS